MKMSRKWQILTIVCLGIFMSTLDGSILNIANPTIALYFSVSMQQVQWVVTSYMLVVTSSLLFFGKLGDRVGSDRIYTYGFLFFTIGSLFCGLSYSLPFLVAARCFQALGASMMMATGIGIVSNSFPREERGKAFGITGSIVGLGNTIGPSLGGLLVGKFSWKLIFLVNVPIGILAFLFALRYLSVEQELSEKIPQDKTGNILFAMAVFALVLSAAQNINVISYLPGIALLILFILYERRYAPSPMLDLDLFKNKFFTSGSILGAIVYFTQTAVFFILPFYLERLLGFLPAYSGLIMTIPPLAQVITAPYAGSLSDRIGTSRLVSLAFFLMTSGFLILSSLGTTINLSRIVIGLVIFGVGVASFGSPNSNSIFASVPKTKAGYTGGFQATIRNFSFSIGVAVWVSLFSFGFASSQKHLDYSQSYAQAIHWVYLSAAILSGLGFVLSLIAAKNNHDQPIVEQNSTPLTSPKDSDIISNAIKRP